MKKSSLILACVLCFVFSCTEEERGQYPLDTIPPQQITNPAVKNIPGGAIISYSIPDDDDLLYVKVVYKLDDGTVMEQKASAYAGSVEVEGLGQSKKQIVFLITGDRSKNESEPVEVEIHPDEAPIFGVQRSVKIANDFGGVFLTWENPANADVVITIAAWNAEKNKFTEAENFYTNATNGKGNVRGLPSEEILLGVYLRDRWKNYTDTIKGTYFPLFEEKLDRNKFTRWNPPGIPYENHQAAWAIEKMWDGNGPLVNSGYMGLTTTLLPKSFTFDMGQLAKLSRIKIYQRCTGDQVYTAGNIKVFNLYGSDHPDVSGDISTWEYMGQYESYKPSGSPTGQVTDEDLAFAVAGEDHNVDLDAPPVRYLRFEVLKTWGGAVSFVVAEMEIYGDISE